jgi:hypothetical protein
LIDFSEIADALGHTVLLRATSSFLDVSFLSRRSFIIGTGAAYFAADPARTALPNLGVIGKVQFQL